MLGAGDVVSILKPELTAVAIVKPPVSLAALASLASVDHISRSVGAVGAALLCGLLLARVAAVVCNLESS